MKALVFDVDGTLVDSMGQYADAWLAVLASDKWFGFGQKFSRKDYFDMGGHTIESITAAMFRKNGKADFTEAEQQALVLDQKQLVEKWQNEEGRFPNEITAVTQFLKRFLLFLGEVFVVLAGLLLLSQSFLFFEDSEIVRGTTRSLSIEFVIFRNFYNGP